MNIQNDFMGRDQSRLEIKAAAESCQARLAKMKLQEGEYENYHVKKKNDVYTINLSGYNGFSYTLEKTAPANMLGRRHSIQCE